MASPEPSRQAEVERAAGLIERLLVDALFRVEFRRDPVAACRALELPDLADELEGMGKALYTLELRESRSSLAGVVLAAAAEGVGMAGFARYHESLEGDARVAASQALSRHVLQAVPDPSATPQAASGGGMSAALEQPDSNVADSVQSALDSAQQMSGTAAPAETAGAAADAGAPSGNVPISADPTQPAAAPGAGADPTQPSGNAPIGKAGDGTPIAQDIVLQPPDAAAGGAGGGAAGGAITASDGNGGAAANVQLNEPRAAEAAAGPADDLGTDLRQAEPVPNDGTAIARSTDQPGLGGGGTTEDRVGDGAAPGDARALQELQQPSAAAAQQPDVAAAPGDAAAAPADQAGADPFAAADDAQAEVPASDGASLAANRDLYLTAAATAALQNGTLDPRANTVLARLLASHELAVDVQPGPPGAPPLVVITEVDGEAVAPDAIAPRDIIGQLATLGPDERPTHIVSPWRIDANGFSVDPTQADRIVLDFSPQAAPEVPADAAPVADAAPADPAPAADPQPAGGGQGAAPADDLSLDDPPPAKAAPPVEPEPEKKASGPGLADAADAAPTPGGAAGVPIGAAAVEIAKRYLGTPYSWGGGTDTGPSRGFDQGANTVGFDCSSLMKFAYAQLGVKIPRVTYDQVNAGVEVPRSQLQAGDLILFARGGDVHHVGMYIGDGKFIHAPHTGDVVKISSLDDPYYNEQYHVARRVATGVVPAGVLSAAETEEAAKLAAGQPVSTALPSPGALPAPGGVTPAAAPVLAAPANAPPAPPPDPGQSGVFAAVQNREQQAYAGTFSSVQAVPDPQTQPGAVAPGTAVPIDPTVLPTGPNPYPGDDAGKQALAQWLAREAQKAGLPPELPVMASLVESGVANLEGGDRDSVGFFQMRVGIWNQGDYAGYPDKPELQVKWFIDQALAVKAKRIAEGNTSFETDPNQWGEWIADIERPAEEYRGRYQLRLDEARGLIGSLPPAPAAAPGAAEVVDGAGAVAPTTAAGGGGLVLPVDPSQMAASNAGGQLHGSEFGVVDAEGAPRSDGVKIHAGYDLFANGGAPVRSMITGKVVEARASRGDSGQIFGGTVKVEGADGKVYVFRHVDPSVQVGQTVQAGQQVATVTNWRDGQPHVHMELWKSFGGGYNADNMLDPLDALKQASGAPVPAGGGAAAPVAAAVEPVAAAVPAGVAPGVPTVGAAAVEIAKRYLDTPYYWGGETPDTGFDCSGLMQYAYKQLGIDIPRVTYDQVNAGVEVPRSQLQPGDLVLFAKGGDVHHVGMYIGDGKFIHAPHTGDVVKISSLDEPYYNEQYFVARRVGTGAVPAGVLSPEETQDALAMQGGAVPAAPGAAPGVAPAVDAAGQSAAPAEPSPGAWQSGVFAAVQEPREAPKPSGSTVQFLPAVQAPDPNAVQPAAPVAPAADPSSGPAAQAPATPAPSGDPAAQPLPPLPVDPTNPYPGDAAGKQALAQWLGREAQKAGLPPELPVMAALVESGVANLNFGDRDSVGFFQMRVGIWNQGDYAGYPDKPELQAKWFIDQALAVKAKRLADGNTAFQNDPNQWGEWIADIERPAEQYRGRYQTKLAEAQALLAPAAGAPAAS